MPTNKQQTCEERKESHYESRMEDLRLLWAGYMGEECPECEGEGQIEKSCCDLDDECQECYGEELSDCQMCDGTGELSEDIPDLGNIYEYGLSFDYVAPDTFNAQEDGYFRYQISWGGPSEEFRIYAQKIDDYRFSVYKIEFWFLDWYDGAKIVLSGKDYNFIEELFTCFFVDSGTAGYQFNEAMQDYDPYTDEEDY